MDHWIMAAVGGVLIGAAATLLLWLTGRIAGVSGMLSGVLFVARGDTAWRVAFLLGLVATAGLYLWLVPAAQPTRESFSPIALIVAGLLVGFGTRMANGCTSGHGVCGLARLSGRSFAAVLTFMTTAIATTFVVRHVGGWQ